jgi:hypothetical protein
MRSLRGAPLCALLDPLRVHPDSLRDLEQRAGPALLTSSYLRRRHPLPILALLTTRAALDPAGAAGHTARLRAWVSDIGADAASTPLTVPKVA